MVKWCLSDIEWCLSDKILGCVFMRNDQIWLITIDLRLIIKGLKMNNADIYHKTKKK
jgi:hypothetical protein